MEPTSLAVTTTLSAKTTPDAMRSDSKASAAPRRMARTCFVVVTATAEEDQLSQWKLSARTILPAQAYQVIVALRLMDNSSTVATRRRAP